MEVLRSFGATRVLVFGSYVQDPHTARDIDLAAEGIPLNCAWKADGAISEIVDFPCDLVFKEENPAFYERIKKRAAIVYEQTSIDGVKKAVSNYSPYHISEIERFQPF